MPPAAQVPRVDAVVESTGQHDRPGSSPRYLGDAGGPPSVSAEDPAHPPGAEIPDDRLAPVPGRHDDVAAVRQRNARYVIGRPLPIAPPARHRAVRQPHDEHLSEICDDADLLATQPGDGDGGRTAVLRDVVRKGVPCADPRPRHRRWHRPLPRSTRRQRVRRRRCDSPRAPRGRPPPCRLPPPVSCLRPPAGPSPAGSPTDGQYRPGSRSRQRNRRPRAGSHNWYCPRVSR